MILGIDSSRGTSVGVVSPGGAVRAHQTSDDPRAHAELIGVLIARALDGAGATPADITQVAMGIGPGGFTGLRVGMAAAGAFALSRGLALYPVVSHDALGWLRGEDSVVVTDARRGEVAYSVYGAGEGMRRLVGPALCSPEDLDQRLGEFSRLPRYEGGTPEGADIARVAVEFQRLGLAFPPAAPLYLRAPDVTVTT